MSKLLVLSWLLPPLGVIALLIGWLGGMSGDERRLCFNLGIGCFSGWYLCRVIGNRNGNRITLNNLRIEFQEAPVIREREPGECLRCDMGYYDRMEQFFERHGFFLIGDVIDERLGRMIPPVNSFNRLMQSADGTVSVEIVQAVLPWYGRLLTRIFRLPTKMVALHTELDDGTWLLLMNNPSSVRRQQPEFIHAVWLKPDTPPEELLRAFLEKRNKYLLEHQDRKPIAVRDLAGRIAQGLRRFEKIREFRARVGLITVQDYIAQGGKPEIAAQMHAKMVKIAGCDPVQ